MNLITQVLYESVFTEKSNHLLQRNYLVSDRTHGYIKIIMNG